MVIDLKRCYGCYACVMACKQKNHTPPGVFWSRVLKGETGTYPNTVRQALPVLCMQCEEPSCMEVCPTGATAQREDGIVTIDKDECMGCKYCMMACPYGARYSVDEWESYFPEGLPLSPYEEFCKEQWERDSGVGVATKCDFCLDRLGTDKQPACVAACPANARTFGDLDDLESEASILIRRHRGTVLNPEIGNLPKVYYLAPR
ncbi:MAG: 4Fe-4S dicluster domain-containing protein [Deltaproteobacteria bacterium]|jgi:molybdopterin-containing oxidoreductase family iron-sulfur binding subunit|nr:4Fe-4S dicluster domain-containing protein [Deltaproteobacteria bacterium]MBW2536538.1 4Fe-4S dicluster domain-containing protein [Deltaproteobacteria bacterium]